MAKVQEVTSVLEPTPPKPVFQVVAHVLQIHPDGSTQVHDEGTIGPKFDNVDEPLQALKDLDSELTAGVV